MYLLHHTSQDAPGSESWSVYVEGYHDAQTDVPIDGSQRWVSSHRPRLRGRRRGPTTPSHCQPGSERIRP